MTWFCLIVMQRVCLLLGYYCFPMRPLLCLPFLVVGLILWGSQTDEGLDSFGVNPRVSNDLVLSACVAKVLTFVGLPLVSDAVLVSSGFSGGGIKTAVRLDD